MLDPKNFMKNEFKGGKAAWADAAEIALDCIFFTADDEDEQVADELVSCYNCRYRRWTAESFTCCSN